MKILVIGGGPAGYEAALVASELGAEVTVVDRSGLGGACVLYDCVPSKTLCTTAEAVTWMEAAATLGLAARDEPPALAVDLSTVFARIVWLVEAQSRDIEKKLAASNVRVLHATARLDGQRSLVVEANGEEERLEG